MKAKLVRISLMVFALLALALFVAPKPAYAAACTFTSNVNPSGNWNVAGSWSAVGTTCSTYPGQAFSGDTVIIADGDTITLNVSPANALANLQVGQGTSGTLTIGNSTTDRTLNVTGDITVNSGAIFNSAGNGGNLLNVGGNLINNGTFEMRIGSATADTTFNGTANQTVSGTGGTTDFNLITINNTGAAGSNIVDISSTNFTTPADFLTLTDGTFRLSTGATLDLTGANLNLTAPDGFIVNHASAVVNIGNNDIVVNGGDFRLLAGTVSLGNGNDLFSVNNGTAVLSGGTLNVLGQFQMTGGTTTINGATINIDAQSTSNLGTTTHIFEAVGVANLTFTSGTVIIVDPHSATGTGNAVQMVSGTGTKNFAGSTIQFGNGTSTTAGSTDGFDVNCGLGLNLGSIVVNNPSGTNRHVRLVTNNCTLGGNLTITAGEFRLNGFNLTLAGNFTNDGIFTPGTNTVTFNGSAAQTIGGTNPTTFYNLTINNTFGTQPGVMLNTGATVNGILTLSSDLATGANTLTMGSSATTSGNYDVVGNTCRGSLGGGNTYGSQWTVISGFTLNTGGTMCVQLIKQLPSNPGLQQVVVRDYTLTLTGGSVSSGNVQLHYRDILGETSGAGCSTPGCPTNPNQLKLWRWDGTNTRWVLQGGTNGGSGNASFVSVTGVSSFSPWGIAQNGSTTAVKLSSFSAKSGGMDSLALIAVVGALGMVVLGGLGFSVIRRRRQLLG